ncbi:hypothetical protein [Desulfonatronum parangueonense]
MSQEQIGWRTMMLTDEYDKPILDNTENSDIVLDMRDRTNPGLQMRPPRFMPEHASSPRPDVLNNCSRGHFP